MIRILKMNVWTVFFYFMLTSLPFPTYAAPGCCSHHGGVTGCNTATNHQLCKDGTTSPTCLCSGSTTHAPQKKSKKTTKMPPSTQETTTENTTKPESTTITKRKGCCAKHGGVAKCDNASGYLMCKDGTVSSTCKC